MLRAAGELAAGTIATWTGVRTLGEYITPRITSAATAAGRPAPKVIVSLPVAVTDDEDAARAWVGERFSMATDLPSYRAVPNREGAGLGDVVVAGDEAAVERHIPSGHEPEDSWPHLAV